MKEVINTLSDACAAYKLFVSQNKDKFESEINNFIADFDPFHTHSDSSASVYVWIEPKRIIHYRSKANPVDLIEVKCILFDFRFKVANGKIIIKGIGHFNHEKFKGRNADRLSPDIGNMIVTGFDKISTLELPDTSSVEIVTKNFSELFYKCIGYYF